MENNELVITPVGTVSTYCYEDKNCPGFLVQYGENRILLDCGNGVCENLNLPNDFNNLTIIISHLHPDHYGELLSIAQTSYVFNRLGYLNERIKVLVIVPIISPPIFIPLLNNSLAVISFFLSFNCS